MKKIICLDFDGVLHSYTSGWKGPRTIPDPPVPGALEFLNSVVDSFEVHIFSSRSRYFGGRWAMKRWLRRHFEDVAMAGWDYTPDWFRHRISATAFCDPWPDEVSHSVSRLMCKIKWPTSKPPALLTIDDRALCFQGRWPSIAEIADFRPWRVT